MQHTGSPILSIFRFVQLNLLVEMPSLRSDLRNPLILDMPLVDYCCSLQVLRVILVIILDEEIDVFDDVFAQFLGDCDRKHRRRVINRVVNPPVTVIINRLIVKSEFVVS